ncbi:MAG: LCP family protein [bacterium]
MQNTKKIILFKFLKIFIPILFVGFGIASGGLYFYDSFFYISPYDPSLQQTNLTIASAEDLENFQLTLNAKTTAPVRTNVLVLGVDKEELLTDVIMACSYISTTGEINIMSVPRDTYVSFSGQDLTDLRSINSRAPSYMKLNAVYTYTESTGVEMLQKTVEDLLGVKFDYYVKIDLDAFKYIVDSVGGIYFDVPSGGLWYSDPTQNLNIALKGGYQLLDGDDAEGLVRFRGYTYADLDRVKVQQEFISEFIRQVVGKDNFLDNASALAMSFIKFVETDFNISNLPKYLTSFTSIDFDNINTDTVAGEASYSGDVSYFFHSITQSQATIDDFFYGSTAPISSSTSSDDTIDNSDE